MPDSFCISTKINSTPEKVFKAWLDSGEHSGFTCGKAEIEPVEGGRFTVWDGYISGTTLEIVPFTRITQLWRTSDFPEEAADSRLEVLFKAASDGVELTLCHSEIPDGQGEEYKQGWIDYYFNPMKEYFG